MVKETALLKNNPHATATNTQPSNTKGNQESLFERAKCWRAGARLASAMATKHAGTNQFKDSLKAGPKSIGTSNIAPTAATPAKGMLIRTQTCHRSLVRSRKRINGADA
ncbi:hypothetical protein NtRootA4_28900 [Arthrobacter sp. NtRootA4]|nr:hypothetical protein NtRootA2_31090 [Arthrobacter sp. NtRootA2]BCW15911.1 hypothetical protein NtRootA4_28900 [Arthrobacter sp. NtRootA4]BCW24244.1 hypothetical protein NtRootC7_31110 [Arthrobacter sp. NtRootC7]BCW28512.1 hypothetical protein NtRootC45_31120 [Arthrobacter sp. NtRootC45]BCW32783.1 hypothetical protein NtRootD5_31140 [Arthrobacter sp. NtRootD5]